MNNHKVHKKFLEHFTLIFRTTTATMQSHAKYFFKMLREDKTMFRYYDFHTFSAILHKK